MPSQPQMLRPVAPKCVTLSAGGRITGIPARGRAYSHASTEGRDNFAQAKLSSNRSRWRDCFFELRSKCRSTGTHGLEAPCYVEWSTADVTPARPIPATAQPLSSISDIAHRVRWNSSPASIAALRTSFFAAPIHPSKTQPQDRQHRQPQRRRLGDARRTTGTPSRSA